MKKYLFSKLNLDLITISILTLVVIPLNLSRSSKVAYNFELIFSLLLTAFLISLILIIFSFLVIKIFSRFNVSSLYSFLVGFLLIWIFLTGNFFPVSGLPGPFLNLDLSLKLRYMILLKIILFFSIYLFLIIKDKKNYFFRFIYFFVIANTIFLFFNIKNINNQKLGISINEFGKKNLIVLSFDGISGHKIYQEITKDKNLLQNLKDFKFYKNVVSGGPHTWPSINLEINGKLESNEDLSKNILNKKDINTLVYGTYISALSDKKKGILGGELFDYSPAFKLNNFAQTFLFGSIGRWATPIGVMLVEPMMYEESYKNFLNLVSFDDDQKINPYDSIKTRANVNLLEYDYIFDNIAYNNNIDKVIRMYHFTFSHWPITVNENCEEVRFLDPKISSFEHESVVLKCVTKKIVKFLNNLKKNELYNNSMIVIKSDHGKPNCVERTYTKKKIKDFFKQRKCNKYYKEYPYTEKINNNYYWGFGRYKVFVLIKDSNEIKDEMVVSNKQVFLHDLSSTYCNFFYSFKECSYLNKNNLIENEDQFSINNYDIYIPKLEKPLSTTQFEDLKKYTISNDQTFLDFLKSNKIITSN